MEPWTRRSGQVFLLSMHKTYAPDSDELDSSSRLIKTPGVFLLTLASVRIATESVIPQIADSTYTIWECTMFPTLHRPAIGSIHWNRSCGAHPFRFACETKLKRLFLSSYLFVALWQAQGIVTSQPVCSCLPDPTGKLRLSVMEPFGLFVLLHHGVLKAKAKESHPKSSKIIQKNEEQTK